MDSGVVNMWRWTFIEALQNVNELGIDRLNPGLFKTKLLKFLRYSFNSIVYELDRFAPWFSFSGTYYYAAGNVRSASGSIANPLSTVTRCHMNNGVNPNICVKVTADKRRKIEATEPHNILHNFCLFLQG